MANSRLCSIPDCGKPTRSGVNPYCDTHYRANLRYGDPLAKRKKQSAPGEAYRWLIDHSQHQGQDCLEWPFTISQWGYGAVSINKSKRVASRVMCEEAHGMPPTGEHEAAHFCGNSRCVNPNHLRWATPSENQIDRVAHETSNRGSRHGLSKLTPEKVKQIRHLAKIGQTHKEIAAKMSVNRVTITDVVSGRRWAWLP